MAKKTKKEKKIRRNSKGGEKRRQEQYPGLKPGLHPKARGEYMDYDYIHKLDHKAKEFLSGFSEEHYGGSFQHKGKILNKKKADRRDCYNRNNARNRDTISRSRTRGWIEPIEGNVSAIDKKSENPEDFIIEMLDAENGEFSDE